MIFKIKKISWALYCVIYFNTLTPCFSWYKNEFYFLLQKSWILSSYNKFLSFKICIILKCTVKIVKFCLFFEHVIIQYFPYTCPVKSMKTILRINHVKHQRMAFFIFSYLLFQVLNKSFIPNHYQQACSFNYLFKF